MSTRRGASGLSGIVLIDKPAGMTSHDVVNRVRRVTGERRVGHAGTLDPMATGLLVVLVGPATRLAPYLTAAQKEYVARITFGYETDTDDADGRITVSAGVADGVGDVSLAKSVVGGLVGTRPQTPPAYSAIKRDGVTAYQAARRGDALELEPRTVEVKAARLLDITRDPITWEIAVSVSKGTYIRAIARDLGRQLGSAAHLSQLRRVKSGAMSVASAITLPALESLETLADVATRFFDPIAALDMPTAQLTDAGFARVSAGSALSPHDHLVESVPEGGQVAVVYGDSLCAVYAVSGAGLRAVTVIPGGVKRGSARE